MGSAPNAVLVTIRPVLPSLIFSMVVLLSRPGRVIFPRFGLYHIFPGLQIAFHVV